MKAMSLVIVFIRFFAIYLFIEHLTYVLLAVAVYMRIFDAPGNLMWTEGEGMLTSAVLLSGLTALFCFAVSCVLFLKAHAIARFFLPDKEEEVHLSGKLSDSFETCLFRCLGIYALIKWGPDFIQTLIQTIIYCRGMDDTVHPPIVLFFQNWEWLSSPTIGILLGLLLIFRASWLTRIVTKQSPAPKAPPTGEVT